MERICFKCEKQLQPAIETPGVADNISNAPDNATYWITSGNWGSQVFDSFGESYLEMYICDECLKKHANLVYELSEYPVRKEVNVRKFKP